MSMRSRTNQLARNFASLGKTGGEGKSLPDVLLLKVGKIRQ